MASQHKTRTRPNPPGPDNRHPLSRYPRESPTYSKRWTPEEEKVLDHATRDWYKLGWESDDNWVWVRSSDGTMIEIRENKSYRPQYGKFEVRVGGSPWKERFYVSPEETLESLQDLVMGGDPNAIQANYKSPPMPDLSEVEARSTDGRFRLDFVQDKRWGRQVWRWEAEHDGTSYIVYVDEDGLYRLAVDNYPMASQYEVLGYPMTAAADIAQGVRSSQGNPSSSESIKKIKNRLLR